jgi:hypothetical protein
VADRIGVVGDDEIDGDREPDDGSDGGGEANRRYPRRGRKSPAMVF